MIAMTKDEEAVLSCAKQIQQYCKETKCIDCIFAETNCLVNGVPTNWLLEYAGEGVNFK